MPCPHRQARFWLRFAAEGPGLHQKSLQVLPLSFRTMHVIARTVRGLLPKSPSASKFLASQVRLKLLARSKTSKNIETPLPTLPGAKQSRTWARPPFPLGRLELAVCAGLRFGLVGSQLCLPLEVVLDSVHSWFRRQGDWLGLWL